MAGFGEECQTVCANSRYNKQSNIGQSDEERETQDMGRSGVLFLMAVVNMSMHNTSVRGLEGWFKAVGDVWQRSLLRWTATASNYNAF